MELHGMKALISGASIVAPALGFWLAEYGFDVEIVEHYNHQRYHKSLNNVTPADAYFCRAPGIIKQRERIKRQTIEYRRLQHRKLAA